MTFFNATYARTIEPFPLSPFPFRDGGTKSEKAAFHDSITNVIRFTYPPLSLRDISPKGGGTEPKALSNPVPPPLKGEGDRGRGPFANERTLYA